MNINRTDGSYNARLSPKLLARLRALRSPRCWLIVGALTRLHVRYWFFEPVILPMLSSGKHQQVLSLTASEMQFASTWNYRISKLLILVNAPYALCMKRSLVMAMMLEGEQDLWLVMGILAEDHLQGHAWLELNGVPLCESFVKADCPYIEIRRLYVRPNFVVSGN